MSSEVCGVTPVTGAARKEEGDVDQGDSRTLQAQAAQVVTTALSFPAKLLPPSLNRSSVKH